MSGLFARYEYGAWQLVRLDAQGNVAQTIGGQWPTLEEMVRYAPSGLGPLLVHVVTAIP